VGAPPKLANVGPSSQANQEVAAAAAAANRTIPRLLTLNGQSRHHHHQHHDYPQTPVFPIRAALDLWHDMQVSSMQGRVPSNPLQRASF